MGSPGYGLGLLGWQARVGARTTSRKLPDVRDDIDDLTRARVDQNHVIRSGQVSGQAPQNIRARITGAPL
jgi:hypothetical protein